MQKLNSDVRYILVGSFQSGGCSISKFRNTQTRRSAKTRYRPWRGRCARVKRQLLGKWPRGLPHLREMLLFCACARGGKFACSPRDNFWGRISLSRSQPEIETKHPFSVDFPILELVRTNIRFHMQCSQILLKANLVDSVDQDLWLTSVYLKQWPEIGTRYFSCSVHRSYCRQIL